MSLEHEVKLAQLRTEVDTLKNAVQTLVGQVTDLSAMLRPAEMLNKPRRGRPPKIAVRLVDN